MSRSSSLKARLETDYKRISFHSCFHRRLRHTQTHRRRPLSHRGIAHRRLRATPACAGCPAPPSSTSDFTQVFAMSRSGQPPDLKKYMDKQLQIKLNANRTVVGTLRGFDQFMNLVIDNTVEVNGDEKNDIGMVVIRGNSVVTVEALEPVSRGQ
ncbi:hypothetical protein LXL04_038390 [Taraxacum kok-saghyz]